VRHYTLPRGTVHSLRFSACGSFLAVGQPGVVWVIDLREDADHHVEQICSEQLDGPPGGYHRVAAATPDGRFVTAWGLQVNRIEPATGRVLVVSVRPTGVARFALSPDGKYAVAGIGNCGEGLRLWALGRGSAARVRWETPEVNGTAWPVFGFFPDGKRLAVAGRQNLDERAMKIGGNLAIHSTRDGTLFRMRAMPISGPEQVIVTPDCSRVLVLTTASFHVFDADDFTAKPVRVVNPKRAKVEAWVMHPAGRQVVTVGRDALVRVWDTAAWTQAAAFQWDAGPLTSVTFHPDGTLCAVAGPNGKVVVWDWDF
jgi:WD40 repeat protein